MRVARPLGLESMSSPHVVAPGPLRVMGALTGGLSVLGSLVIIIVFAPRIKSLYHGPARSTSHQEVSAACWTQRVGVDADSDFCRMTPHT